MMDFTEELSQTAKEADQVILGKLPAISGLQKSVLEAMDYAVAAGGKRIRPVMIRKAYEMFAGEEMRSMRPVMESFMAAMEMIHTFSLCHDDLPCMDNDRYRRGREAVWYRYGEDMGTLTGDALALYAFECIGKAYKSSPEASGERVLRAMHILAETSGVNGMLGGQVVDVEMTGGRLNEEQLSFIYRLKTGALLKGSLMIGAVLGGADDAAVSRIGEIGEKIGVAFQIQDDILDETSTDEELGKPVHSDALNQKTTYVTIHGLEASRAEVVRLSREAMEALEGFDGEEINGEAREFLKKLTEMLIHRRK